MAEIRKLFEIFYNKNKSKKKKFFIAFFNIILLIFSKKFEIFSKMLKIRPMFNIFGIFKEELLEIMTKNS